MDTMKTQIIDGKAIHSDNDIRPGRAIHGCGKARLFAIKWAIPRSGA